jgi:hypothetical protein
MFVKIFPVPRFSKIGPKANIMNFFYFFALFMNLLYFCAAKKAMLFGAMGSGRPGLSNTFLILNK